MKKSIFIITILSLITFHESLAQVKAANIAFYNLENLFDTINDPKINDEDFLPDGSYSWDTYKYQNKLDHMSEVISIIGDAKDGSVKWNGPTILGVSEIENRRVLEDLVNHPKLKSSNYGIVHYNSPDHRGIDVALLYKKDFFKVLSSKTFEYFDPEEPERKSRDQLLVTGVYDEDTMHFIVNHWPSRRAPSPKRVIAAKICRGIVDSLLAINENAKIFVMGDFNDTPTDPSLYYLEHKSEKKKPENRKVIKLHNGLRDAHKSGRGSHCYRDVWSVFDMIIVSPGVMNGPRYKFQQIQIFERPWMHEDEGRFKGYPLRTHAGGNYLNGYSDHMPVYMFITEKVKK